MKFLIVDDDPACRRFLGAILSPYGHCDQAFDGAEAIDAVRLAIEDRRPYDLVCLDIMMPKVDGHETLDRIRQLEHEHGLDCSAGTKVIMTTALTDSKHCIRCFREGCEAYCTKPLDGEEILARARELLGRLPEPSGPVEAAAAEDAVAETPPDTPAPAHRFLVVDDDRVSRELLGETLSPHGLSSFAYDGQEAVDAVRLAIEDGRPYDLICLDIMMPGLDGHEALEAIRKIETEHGIYGSDGVKVIMTTALHDSKHCIRSFKEGCESYVTKPIDEQQLLARMREVGVLEENRV